MVLANYLRQRFLEPLKERQRREGWEEGYGMGFAQGLAEVREENFAQNFAIGYAEGRAESYAIWRAWNERREKAAERGEPFDEPPPSLDD